MTRNLSTVLLVLATAAAVSCGDSPTSPGPTPQGLAGTWRATLAEYVSIADPNVRVEAVSHGTTIVLVLESTGSFTLTTTDPGAAPEVIIGTWTASADVITMNPTNRSGNIQFDFTMNGSTLTITGGHVAYDVNGDDADEEAILTMTLARQ